jgi:hypothetical protein
VLRGEPPANLITQLRTAVRGRWFSTYAYFCWAGLVDFVTVVEVEGFPVAVIFAGQYRFTGELPAEMKSPELIEAEGRQSASRQLGISSEALLHLMQEVPSTSVGDLRRRWLPALAEINARVTRLAYERYVRLRDERDQYFLRELTVLIERETQSTYGIKDLASTLARLRQYLGVRSVYFLLGDFLYPDKYRVVAMASGIPNDRQTSLSDALIEFPWEKPWDRDRVTVVSLTSKKQYARVLFDLKAAILGPDDCEIALGSCPLEGGGSGFWLFVGPEPRPGQRPTPAFTQMDFGFLGKFCATTHAKINQALATTLVMRRIGHELGAGIQSMVFREQALRKSIADPALQREVDKNLTQLQKYHAVLASVRSLFIRKGERGAIHFQMLSIGRPIMDAYEACLLDDELLKRHLVFHRPDLTRPVAFEMDQMCLYIAFFNLFQNAIKYSFNRHYISVIGRPEKSQSGTNCYRIDVSNFGTGITPEEIERRLVFRENYRGILSHDRNRTGTGLGLPVVERFVAIHGGTVEVRSMPVADFGKNRPEDITGAQEVDRLTHDATADLTHGYLTIFTVRLPTSHA